MKHSLASMSIMLWAALSGCDPAPGVDGGPPDVPPGTDAPIDAPAPDGGFSGCLDDGDCDDGAFCNGIERCRPEQSGADALGCVTGTGGCLAGQTCMEVGDRCVTECAVEEDADDDGAVAAECGGLDCDDSDPARRPRLPEVCGDDAHDEDCDESTVGDRDADGDGAIDALCCNGTTCGTDCNDARADVRPGGTEVCDGLDQDCNGTVDEGTLAAGYPDLDGDLHGDASASASMACEGLGHRAPNADDCDDGNPAVHEAQSEIDDGLDNDCDTRIDEDVQTVTFYRDLDGDGFGNAASGTTRSDAPVIGFSVLSSDCDDAAAGVRPSANESCNAIDDDCDGIANFVIEPGDLEDDDRDGVADSGCGGADCNDADATTYPDALELCDSRDNDCDGTVDDGSEELAWLLDRDGDGAGDDRSPIVYTCELVSGRVVKTGDCDDDDPDRSPGLFDGCLSPGVDDDCDGRSDEAGALMPFYPDLDLDGVGAGAARLSCSAAAGVSARDDDCDDDASARAPGLTELCTGNVDEDCDGAVDCADPGCTGSPDCTILYTLSVIAGSGQSARIASPLASPIRVRLLEGANPLSGRTVTLSLPEGAHAVTTTGTTDAAGEATFSVWVGRAVGAYTFTISTSGAAPVTVSATATAPSAGTVHTLLDRAGVAGTGAAADGAAAAARPLSIDAIEVAADGTLYVSDPLGHAVYAVSPRGALSRVAGSGVSGSSGDGDSARLARLISPRGLALDETGGRLFIADSDAHRIRVVYLSTGTIDTYAGTGSAVVTDASGVPALLMPLPFPRAITLAEGADLVVVEDDGRVHEIDGATGLVRQLFRFTFADPSVDRMCERGCDVAAIAGGDVLISGRVEEFCNGMGAPRYGVYRLGARPLRVVGECSGVTADGTPGRLVDLGSAAALGIEPSGDLLVGSDRLVRIASRTTRAFTVAGNVGGGGGSAEDLTARAASVTPQAIAVQGTTVYFADGVQLRAIEGFARSTTESASLTAPSGATGDIVSEVNVQVTVADATPIAQALVHFDAVSPGLVPYLEIAVTNGAGEIITPILLGRRVGTQSLRAHLFDLHGRDVPGSPITISIAATRPPAGRVVRIFNTQRTYESFPSGMAFDPALQGVPGPAAQAYGGPIRGLAVASDGTVYFTSSHRVVAVSPEGLATVIAGGGTESDPGMDVPASAWRFFQMDSLALDEGTQTLYAMNRGIAAEDLPGVFAIDLVTRRVRHLYASSGPRPARPGVPFPAFAAGAGNLSIDGTGTLRTGWLTIDRTTGAIGTATIPSSSGACAAGGTLFPGGGFAGFGYLADGSPHLLASGYRAVAPCDCSTLGIFLAEPVAGSLVARAGGCLLDADLSEGAFSVGHSPGTEALDACGPHLMPWVGLSGERVLFAPLGGFDSCRSFVEVDLATGLATDRDTAPIDVCITGDGCGGGYPDYQLLVSGASGTYVLDYVDSSSSFDEGLSGAVGQLF
jgi:hypothetical protein